jgi:hypothetical protein
MQQVTNEAYPQICLDLIIKLATRLFYFTKLNIIHSAVWVYSKYYNYSSYNKIIF